MLYKWHKSSDLLPESNRRVQTRSADGDITADRILRGLNTWVSVIGGFTAKQPYEWCYVDER